MQTIDARGLSCPQPVLMTAEGFKANESEKEFVILVDDFAPLENVTRYAKNHGFSVSHEEKEDYTEIHCTRN